MDKIKVGVLGWGRGAAMINYCIESDNAELVAICDKYQKGLDFHKKLNDGMEIAYYTDYDEFLKHDMDAVIISNYANEHAPFAIKAMRAGKHVFSECLPVQSMKEAVELVEAIEETGMVYAYGENYCYANSTMEMKRLYKEGKIGEFEYGEGEYVHNCELDWENLAYGDPTHWRNNMYSTFYCTHSLGPLIHITGLKPVKVVGFEGANNERNLRVGAKHASFGMELVTLENGAVVKSIHGALYTNSIWYSLYGSKGRMETAREDAGMDGWYTLHVKADDYSGQYQLNTETYKPEGKNDAHGGGDYFAMYNFIEYLRGDKNADIIDVYEALDAFLPGYFAYLSILNGNIPMDIPNLRNKEERDTWRNYTGCTDPKHAGEMLWPTCSKGTLDIPDKVYENQRKRFEQSEKNEESGLYQTVVTVRNYAKENTKESREE